MRQRQLRSLEAPCGTAFPYFAMFFMCDFNGLVGVWAMVAFLFQLPTRVRRVKQKEHDHKSITHMSGHLHFFRP